MLSSKSPPYRIVLSRKIGHQRIVHIFISQAELWLCRSQCPVTAHIPSRPANDTVRGAARRGFLFLFQGLRFLDSWGRDLLVQSQWDDSSRLHLH